MGTFISFEGIEGCGKSYQSRILYRRLMRRGCEAVLTMEPGGTPLGNAIRNLLKSTRYNISPETELFLFNASRSQLIGETIRPSLEQDKVVVCDRFTDSTLVYQGYGRGLDIDTVIQLNIIASGEIKPDLTILLDLPVEAGLERKKERHNDRFDAETLEFHNRIRRGFLQLARQDKNRWLVIDGLQSKKAISALIWERVEQLLGDSLPD